MPIIGKLVEIVQLGVGLGDHVAIFFVGGQITDLLLDKGADGHIRDRGLTQFGDC